MSQPNISQAPAWTHGHFLPSRFSLAYQPVISLKDGPRSVVAFEALLRIHGNGGAIEGPAELVAKAESDGSIVAIDRWVLSQVIALAKARPQLSVWINTSQLSIAHPTFVEDAVNALVASGLLGRVAFEVTETADVDAELLAKRLESIRVQAMTVLIDDIRDGFAKKGLLLSSAVAGCKLSRETTQELMVSERARAEVQLLVRMCRLRGKQVVLEGIETPDELKLANDLKITLCQGYYFCKPASPVDLQQYGQMRPIS